MIIDIVQYYTAEDFYALYIDGKLKFSGDAYHNKILEYINGFLAGLKLGKVKFIKNNHIITNEMEEQFANDGYKVPKKFPNKYILKKKRK